MKVVEVHPNWNLVGHTEACVSVRERRPRKHVYNMGTVHLANVRFLVNESGVTKAQRTGQRNVHAWVIGELLHEAVEQEPLDLKIASKFTRVTYHFSIGRFLTVEDKYGRVVDVTDGRFAAAVQVGRNLYIAKEW